MESAICFIFAHPDDEAFGVAGTAARYAAAGVRTALVCTTRGEAGMTGGLADAPAALGVVRSAELACAGRQMGLDDLLLFDFSDGEGSTWDREALAAHIEGALRRLQPTVVVTFDAHGITDHPDHIVVHEVTRRVILDAGRELGIRRLYYQVVTCPEEASPEGPGLACVPCETVDVCVDIREFEAVKRAALRCHCTQAADTAHLLDQPVGNLAVEHYQLAWTDDDWRPAPGETDLLAGL